ncbi:MAG: PfkB family carbohydrate kinase [Bacteroidota bacterium]
MKNKHQTTEFLCIGFLCHDQIKQGYVLGGSASYASLAAKRMGKRTAVLTSVGEDFKFLKTFEKQGILIENKKAKKTTVFKNIYKKKIRRQYLLARADKLKPKDLPENWKQPEMVLLALIADEASFSFLKEFPGVVKGVIIQGWLRKWDVKGKVSPKKIDWKKLNKADIVFLSKEDIQGNKTYLKRIKKQVKIVALTRGKKGATIFYENKKKDFPAFPADEVDPTGCGDMFAAAFMIKYNETKNIDQATAYANAAASLVVEKVGANIPSLKKINQRYKKYQEKFLAIK